MKFFWVEHFSYVLITRTLPCLYEMKLILDHDIWASSKVVDNLDSSEPQQVGVETSARSVDDDDDGSEDSEESRQRLAEV